MAFAIAGKRRAVLLQHDEIYDEEGWRMVVKIWKWRKAGTVLMELIIPSH